MATAAFRFQGKHVLLTFAQNGLEPLHLLDALSDKFHDSDNNISHYTICSELHADGSPHGHALLSFEKKFSTRDVRFFDIGATDDDDGWHPNWSVVPNAKALKGRVGKEERIFFHLCLYPSLFPSST